MRRTVLVGNVDETAAQTYLLLEVPHTVRHIEQSRGLAAPGGKLNRTLRTLLALLGPLLLVLLGGAVFEGTATAAAPPAGQTTRYTMTAFTNSSESNRHCHVGWPVG
jgi:hypothetical protein